MNSFFTTPIQQFTSKTRPASTEDYGIDKPILPPVDKPLTTDNFLDKSSRDMSGNEKDFKAFEILYNHYAPKIFGFLILHSDTKEQAEKYVMEIFLKVWDDIKNFNVDAEKKINKILLVNCRPLFQKSKIY